MAQPIHESSKGVDGDDDDQGGNDDDNDDDDDQGHVLMKSRRETAHFEEIK